MDHNNYYDKKQEEDGAVLCCCEYYNMHGERSHLLEAICDCQILDDICEGLLQCKWAGKEQFLQLFQVIHDRMRIPWLDGHGARRCPWPAVLPMILLPSMLKVASHGFWTTLIVIFCFMPLIMFCYYASIISNRRRTPFFLSWTLTSILGMLYAFLRYIAPRCDIGKTVEVFIGLLTAFLIFLLCLRDPGVVKPLLTATKSDNYVDYNNQETYDNNLLKICPTCRVHMPRRSHHCGICHQCVNHFDHHCVWINNCVGQGNRRIFVLLLLEFVCTASRGLYFSLMTVCSWDQGHLNCPAIYEEDWSSIVMASIMYSCVATVAVASLLSYQVILISRNITSYEWRCARRAGFYQDKFGQPVKENIYNKGFIKNWIAFLRGYK